MKTHRVWFGQVNQTFIDVDAMTRESAKKKAVARWKEDVGDPPILKVEKLEEE